MGVASVDRMESVHTLASKLLASKLQRIFLTSEELARIVGMVSARDILVEVLEDMQGAARLAAPSAAATP